MSMRPSRPSEPLSPSPASLRDLVTGFWTDSPHTLELTLRPEQARERLAARLAPMISMPGTHGDRQLEGRVHADGFSLAVRTGYNNSFKTFARGRWEAHGSRLRIALSCGVHPFAKLFMGAWLGMCGLFCVLFPLATLGGGRVMTRGPGGQMVAADLPTTLMFAIAPLPMLAFGLALCAFGRYLARNEEATLLAVIEDALRNP